MLSKVTVPELWVNVGVPETVKSPDKFKAPDEDGAVKVPPDSVNVPLTSTMPEEPENVPEDTVNPPLKVCVPVDAVYRHHTTFYSQEVIYW